MEAVHSEEEHVSPLAMVWEVLAKAGVPRPKADLAATKNPRSAGGFEKVFSPKRCAFKAHWGEVCRDLKAPLHWCRIWLARQALAKAARERA